MEYGYTNFEIEIVSNHLTSYYGIKRQDIDAIVGTTHDCKKIMRWEESIRTIYSPLGNVDRDDEILQTLMLLAYCLSKKSDLLGFPEYEKRRDLLKLYLFCMGTKDGDAIIVKNKTRCYHIDNQMNWVVNELILPFCVSTMGEGVSPSSAELELESLAHRHRGRRYKDPRVPILLLGTFRLLSDLHGFHTPMPNVLCAFMIDYLQLLEVFSENTDVDIMWIRAQLRYIQSKNRHVVGMTAK